MYSDFSWECSSQPLSFSSALISRLFALFGASPRLVNFPEMHPNTVAIVHLSRGAPPSATRSLGPHLDLPASNPDLRMTNVNSRIREYAACFRMNATLLDDSWKYSTVAIPFALLCFLSLFDSRERKNYFHRDSWHFDKRFVIYSAFRSK